MRKSTDVIAGFGMGAAVGALVMFISDPEHGRRRRALLRDKLVGAWNDLSRFVDATCRDIENRMVGQAVETASRLRPEPVPDDVLVERVRSEMGHSVDKPSAIEVHAREGHVTLRGSVRASEVDALLSRVSSVRGVRSVENQLVVQEGPEMSSRQGTGSGTEAL